VKFVNDVNDVKFVSLYEVYNTQIFALYNHSFRLAWYREHLAVTAT